MAVQRLPHPHALHPHLPHPRLEIDGHPWRAVPVMLLTIVVLVAVVIAASFEIAKVLSGHAY
jgi:hypothetical protein